MLTVADEFVHKMKNRNKTHIKMKLCLYPINLNINIDKPIEMFQNQPRIQIMIDHII